MTWNQIEGIGKIPPGCAKAKMQEYDGCIYIFGRFDSPDFKGDLLLYDIGKM